MLQGMREPPSTRRQPALSSTNPGAQAIDCTSKISMGRKIQVNFAESLASGTNAEGAQRVLSGSTTYHPLKVQFETRSAKQSFLNELTFDAQKKTFTQTAEFRPDPTSDYFSTAGPPDSEGVVRNLSNILVGKKHSDVIARGKTIDANIQGLSVASPKGLPEIFVDAGELSVVDRELSASSSSGVLQWPHWKPQMSETILPGEDAVLEVVSPDGARRYIRVTQTPFLIGRGAETGNHLQLSDRRISRNCAAIVIEANRFYIEDRGQRRGLYINGEKVESRELQNGDVITFGLEDSYEIFFRFSSGSDEASIPHLLTKIEHITSSEPSGGGLRKLNLLRSEERRVGKECRSRWTPEH